MDWFTSDHHFYHKNIIKLTNRPFADIDEMHDVLIKNWNERVTNDDTVYVLGDFCFSGYRKALSIICQLNGKIKFVPGGHDKWVKNFGEHGGITILPYLYTLEYKKRGTKEYPLVVVLCHYPMLSWDRSNYGSILLHGHSHGNIKEEMFNSMDVGVDCNNFSPISIEEILHKFCRL